MDRVESRGATPSRPGPRPGPTKGRRVDEHGRQETDADAPDEARGGVDAGVTPSVATAPGERPGAGGDVPDRDNAPPARRPPPPLIDGLDDLDDDGDVVGPMPFALFVVFEAALAPLSLLAGRLVGTHPLEQFAWDGQAVIAGAMAALPMLGVLAVVLRRPVGPFARIKAFFDRELMPALTGCEWPDLAVLSVAAGVGEEMLFRGVVQGALSRLLGPAPAVVLASALFGLLHPISLGYIVLAGLLGAYLGLVWIVTGNLLAVMVAHALYDFVALVLLMRDHQAAAPGDE